MNLSFGIHRDSKKYKVIASVERQCEVTGIFSLNVETAIKDNNLFIKASPGYILKTMARFAQSHCPNIFQSISATDQLADKFIEHFLRGTRDSFKGQQYCLPEDVTELEAFISLGNLKQIAAARLLDTNLGYPVKAAWRSVVEDCSIYGIDGTVADERF